MRGITAALLATFLALCVASCSGSRDGRAYVWTDVPDLALAVELFDALPEISGDGHSGTVEVHWKPDLAEALRSTKSPPALVVGRHLGMVSIRNRFSTLDHILGDDKIKESAFYPELLEAGKTGGRHILLPISFNLPVIVFARGSSSVGDGFTLSLDEMSGPAAAFNKMEGGAFTRMGFSPRWDGRFLVSALEAGGARFMGDEDLTWSDPGFASTLGEIVDWVSRTNRSAVLEDDFQFKYLFAPPYRTVLEGLVLYTCMDSSEYLLAPAKRRDELDFRWFARNGKLPVADGIVAAGIVRGAPGRKTAEAFLRWLLGSGAQRTILERSRRVHALDFSFGIAGGFSSLRSVNEETFPEYFPALSGHAPPAALSIPDAFASTPEDWPALQTVVLEPWAQEATAGKKADIPAKIRELSVRMTDYHRRGNLQ